MKTNLFLISLIFTIVSASSLCNTCIRATTLLQNGIIKVTPEFVAKDLVESVCQRLCMISSKLDDSQELCSRISEQLTPLAIRVAVRGILKTGKLCQYACGKGFYTKINLKKEVDNIIQGRLFESFQDLAALPYAVKNISLQGRGNTKILHLTDIHLDLNYTQNSSVNCNYPICCHKEDGFPVTETGKAPQFGIIKCDTPVKLFNSGLDYIKNQIPDLDAVMVTGDFSAHNEWQKTQETVVQVKKFVEDKLQSTLDIEIITALGNNQYLPDHQVDPMKYPEDSLKVYNVKNSDGQMATFVSINTLFCDNMNLYLIEDQTMSIRQIKTLNIILEKNENVIILGHISPTSSSCSQTYAILFRSILARNSKKIKGQFYGHTHMDQFVVNTDPRNNLNSTSFGLLGGSFSPLNTGLPRFRVYEFTSNFELYNYVDYRFNPSQKSWGINYDFKFYYGIEFQRPINTETMSQFQERIESDDNLRSKYDAKASGTSAGSKFYCQTYDSQEKINACVGKDLGSRKQLLSVLTFLQGPWGAYGEGVQ